MAMKSNKIKRLVTMATGTLALFLSDSAKAIGVKQQSSSGIQSEAQILSEQTSLLQLDSVQQVINQAMEQILAQSGSRADQQSSIEALADEAANTLLTESELNSQLLHSINQKHKNPNEVSLVQTDSSAVEGILAFDCVVGQKNCIYKNKQSLAQGKMTTDAKTKLISNINKKKPEAAPSGIKQKMSSQPSKTNLAQTDKHKKTVKPAKAAVKAVVKQTIVKPAAKTVKATKTTKTIKKANKAAPSKPKTPGRTLHVQQKQQVNTKTKDFAGHLISEQKRKLAGLKNPLDHLEDSVRAKLDTHAQADIHAFDKLAQEVRAPAKDAFQKVLRQMNHHEVREQHVTVQQETASMNVDHKIRDGERYRTGSVRTRAHTQGNQGVEAVQQTADVHVKEEATTKSKENREDLKQVDLDGMSNKTSNPTTSSKLQKAAELVSASQHQDKLKKQTCKQAACPTCKDCPVCQAQTISPLEELATHSNELTFLSADEKPEDVKLSIFPQDTRDFVTKDVQVLNSERIVGYNTYNNILEKQQSKGLNSDSNSDFYNITVNFVMKRKNSGSKEGKQSIVQKELPISVYENSINEAERLNKDVQVESQRKVEQDAEESNEPKVIMPNEIELPQKDKSVHGILQESRISKDDDQTAVQTQEAQGNAEAEGTQVQEQPAELVATGEAQTERAESKTEQKVTEGVQQEVEQLPIELSNAQLQAQLENLSPDEAVQLVEEAQAAAAPQEVSNLMLSDNVIVRNASFLSNQTSAAQKSANKTTAHSNSSAAITFQQHNLTGTNSSNMDISKMSKQEMVQQQQQVVTNSSQQATGEVSGRDKQHLEFLTKVQKKAEQDIKDEQKGIQKPVTNNKKTQEMYSQARIEQEEAKMEAQENKLNALSQQSSGNDIDEMTIDEDEEPVVEELTVDEDKVAQLQEPLSVAQRQQRKQQQRKKKGPAHKKLQKALSKRAKIKALTKKLEDAEENADMDDGEDVAKKRQHLKNIKQEGGASDSAIFDAIMNIKPIFVPKEDKEVNWKKLIKFDSHFHKRVLPIDVDKQVTDKPAGFTAKQLDNPFGIHHAQGNKKSTTGAQKKMKEQMKQKKKEEFIREQVAKDISAIFKGKNQLSKDERRIIKHPPQSDPNKIDLNHPHVKADQVIPVRKAKDNEAKAKYSKSMKTKTKRIAKKKQELQKTDREIRRLLKASKKEEKRDERKLKRGITKSLYQDKALYQGGEKRNLRKIQRGLRHINQLTEGSEEKSEEADGEGQGEQSQQAVTPREILNMEESTLKKKIEIDLKVLAKIEKEKNPKIGNFYFKVVQVDEDAEDDEEEDSTNDDEARATKNQAKKNATESLAQKPIEQKSADEYVQSKEHNILEQKVVSTKHHSFNRTTSANKTLSANKTTAATNQTLTQVESQAQAHQQVLQHMSELQKAFEETTKQSEVEQSQKANAESLQKKLIQRAQEEKQKRDELMKKAEQMAQADLLAKHELRKATEQAELDKEQSVHNFQQQLDKEAQALAEKKQALENHKKEVEKAKALVSQAQRAENDVKLRLEKEEKLRRELEQKEQDKTQEAIEKNQELQKIHENQMQKLLKQQIELQNKKKQILQEQEKERTRLEEQLHKVNSVKAELLKVSEPSKKLDQPQQQDLADNLNLLSKQQLIIEEAISKVKKAEEAGAKKGQEEAEKLIKKAHNQSLEQSQADMAHLQKKFQATSSQVKSIIDNFQKVHSDLRSLKNEYIQRLPTSKQQGAQSNSTKSSNSTSLAEASQEAVQLSAKVQMVEQSTLALQMQSKQREIQTMMRELSNMKGGIPDSGLVKQIDETSKVGMMDLLQIEQQLNLSSQFYD